MSSGFSLARLWRIRRVIKQQQLGDLLSELELTPSARFFAGLLFGKGDGGGQPGGERIRVALENLGPVFVKFGQALSTRPDLLPADIAEELTKLQDQVPPFSGDQAMRLIRQCYGEQTDRIFKYIEPQALASASVAQVHAATLQPGLAQSGKNGQVSDQVIIKLLRPNVEEQINQDLRLMYWLAGLLQKYWRQGDQFKPLKIVAEYEATILGELDLRREAANCSQMAANFEHTDIIYVPLVYWDYTQTRVMVMERIYGTSVREVETLKQRGYDLKQLAADGVHTFFKQAFEDNFFHADMHPGNIFVSDQGKWMAVDFGIMGVLDERDKRYLAEMLLGFFNRDYRLIAESHLRAGWIPPDTSLTEFESAIRMVCEPNFAKPISEISFGQVLMELVRTVQRFKMPVQPQLVLLYKTLLQIEGLGRQVYPQLNLWDTAKPFLENWMKQQFSPQTLFNDLKRDWPHWRAALSALPQKLQSERDQHQLIEATESRKSAIQFFHQVLGFTIAALSVATLVSTHGGVLQPSVFSDWSVLSATVGLAWAYWHSR